MQRRSSSLIFLLGLALTFSSALGAASRASASADYVTVNKKEVSTDTVSYKVKFVVGKSVIDPAFKDNAKVLQGLREFLSKMKTDTTRTIKALRLVGSVSPEGPLSANERLVRERAAALRDVIYEYIEVKNEKNERNLPTNLQEVEQMAHARHITVEDMWGELRYASAEFVIDTDIWTEYRKLQEEPTPKTPKEEVVVEVIAAEEPAVEPEPQPEKPGRWHVKTNLIGWGLLVGNVAGEYDFARRWSVALPIYYSAWNYFKSTLKFRTFTIQPELRYWFKDHSDKGGNWFVGAHVGMGWYNYALNGDYRIQDVGGHTPSFGGGLGAGYRFTLPWGSRNRWKMEFALGVGVYPSKYDKWINGNDRPLYQGDIHKTYFGVDNAAVSIVYTFN